MYNLEHSPLGASAAARFIACPGSARLIQKLHRRGVSTETDYSRKGSLAHKIAGFCLGNYQDAWETIGNEALWGGVSLPPDELQAVQKFINMARERIQWFKDTYKEGVSIFVEFPMHRPELHDLAWGTMDLMIVAGDYAEILDYKHGAGVTVEAYNNPQLKMYAGMAILDMPEIRRIRMSLFQPRAFHPSGEPYRSFEMEVPALMKWVDIELTPAMELADPRKKVDPDVDVLKSGDHCQFCPAARECPALRTAMVAVQEARPPAELTNEELGKVFAMIPDVKRRIKALEIEATRRGLAGDPVPGTKIVAAIAHRAWKDGAPAVFVAKFGDAAWAPREIWSPAQMEKRLGEEAADLTKMHAYTPDNGYRVVPVDGKGKAVSLQKPAELYQKYLEDHPIE